MKTRYVLALCAVLLMAIPSNANADRTYKVRKGDNLSRIAERFHVKAERIASANGLESDRLTPGMRLVLPSSPVKAKIAAPQLPGMQSVRNDGAAVEAEARELSEGLTGENGVGGIKERLVRIAHMMLDIPYRFGGSSLLGIDCSGYVQKVFGLLDIVLPRTAREQFRLGTRVGKGELSVGDLVFFRTYAKFPSHVGIYLGGDRFIHASSGERKVTIGSLDAPYYIKRFVGARRLPLDGAADEI